MMSMLPGVGSKPKRTMKKNGTKGKMMLLKKKHKEKNYMKAKKLGAWKPSLSKD